MRVEKIIFTGTPEEFEAVRGSFFTPPADEADASPESDEAGITSEVEVEQTAQVAELELTKDSAVAALTRIALTPKQKALLTALVKADASGLTTVDLALATGLDRGAIKAVLRSFGKRVTYTPGWPKNLEMFDRTWEGDKNRYRLRPAVRDALEDGSVKL